MEVDRAVFYALLLRVWQLLAGAVSVMLIARYFSPTVQGYYYTFFSLLALQTFFELGLQVVVINFSSHEWARLRLSDSGEIEGDETAKSRLIWFGRWLFGWYGVASLLFAFAVGLAGFLFLDAGASPAAAEPPPDWRSPWMWLVLLSGLLLWSLPFNALLEGCQQVSAIYLFRLIQAVLANFAVWTSMVFGWGLWAAVASVGMRWVCDLVLLLVVYRRFFAPFRTRPPRGAVNWRTEIWPMQWRIGIAGVFSYFSYFLFTPVLFHYQGEVIAGQMGMSWTLITAVQAASLSWVQTRAPRFGELIAHGDYGELDRVFFRVLTFSFLAMILGAAGILGLVWVLNTVDLPLNFPIPLGTTRGLAARLLPLPPLTLFVLGVVVYHVPHCCSIYIRAHKREPFFKMNIVGHVAIGAAVWLGGRSWGALGAAAGYLAVVTLLILPWQLWIWWICRRRWHAPAAG